MYGCGKQDTSRPGTPSRAARTVPDDLREVLMEFTMSYLLEQPADVVDYAIDYFTKIKENRVTITMEPSSVSELEEPELAEPLSNMTFNVRRRSVFAETYDPAMDSDEVAIYPKSEDQRKRLEQSVKGIILFRSLDGEQMNIVLDAMFEKRVHSGDYIIKQGDDGDNFYVVETGTFKAYVTNIPGEEPKLIHTYENSGSFGELALLYNMPRAATIQAITDGSLWAMDRCTFRRILLKTAFKKRKMYENLINSVPMLKCLQPYERMNLADALVSKEYKPEEQIIKQGDSADGMYFVEDGVVTITVHGDDGREIEVNKIIKGGYFGELALVTHRPRAASAYAHNNVKLAFLDVDAFERLLGPCMELMKRNFDDYEEQLLRIFGSKTNISDLRGE
ncbi:cAMP-dependent protein kinase type II regulatory subunit-like [Ctenocephalides felis]|uniref:cAMP-dependent protein kinase type II regulatory subunit-like n=1 Tax=Ctenocephalides felis TaxID=7515 RepID=UPI000E6E4B64|nr:cAMP-dependent protein kinase type II regulatory subunit-like [Ctenocephalides felis]